MSSLSDQLPVKVICSDFNVYFYIWSQIPLPTIQLHPKPIELVYCVLGPSRNLINYYVSKIHNIKIHVIF